MEKAANYLDNLLIKHNVSLKKIYDCNVSQKENIDGIKRIFNTEDENDFLLSLVALKLITENNSDKFIECFQKDSEIFYNLDDKFFRENKTLVLTAFIYNPAFFAMAVNMHGLIAYELQKQKRLSVKVAGKISEFISNAKNFRVPSFQLDYIAASSVDQGLISIMKKEDIDLNGIKGKLEIFGNAKDKAVQFEFEFNEAQQLFPFFLEITYLTTIDKKTHKIRLDDKKNNKYVLTSFVQYKIDFTESVIIKKIKGVKIV